MAQFSSTTPDTICWHKRSCNCPYDIFLGYGRVRSGKQWFWHVWGWDRGDLNKTSPLDFFRAVFPDSLTFAAIRGTKYDNYGWADTEEAAIAAAEQLISTIAAGRPAKARVAHFGAAGRLKELNREKRAARPASNATDARPTEYLFATDRWTDWTGKIDSRFYQTFAFPIVKKTAWRIYYKRKRLAWLPEIDAPDVSDSAIKDMSHDDHDIGFVDRQKLEAKGEVYNHGRHWLDNDFHLLARPPDKLVPDRSDLAELKAAMAAAHPDRGGSNAAFIAARKRYVEARARLKAQAAE